MWFLGFLSNFLKVYIQTSEICCINCPCISVELCNKAYYVNLNAKPAYFVVVATKMNTANWVA